MSRYKAAAIHFLGSLLALSLIVLVVWTIWYPGPLLRAASGLSLLAIVLSVDVAAGPLVTFIIFNTQKKSLRFDMATVLICQLAFMLYGVWSIFEARPVYVAFAESRFQLATANQIEDYEQKKVINPAYKRLPILGPEVVGTKVPNDRQTNSDLVFASAFGMGVQNMPQYFVPYAEVADEVKKAGKVAKDVKGMDQEVMKRLAAYEAKQQANNRKVLFLPLIAKGSVLQIAVDASNGTILDILS